LVASECQSRTSKSKHHRNIHLKGKRKRSPRMELTANKKRDMVGQDGEVKMV
jgi:hypothetical protein